MAPSSAPSPPRKTSRGCLYCGGATALGGLCVCLALAAVVFLPGIVGPSADDLAGGAPDPVASAALTSALSEAGLQGARALVFPIRGSDEQFAYIVLDDATGFAGADTAEGSEQAFLDAVQGLSEANQEQDLRVGLVAMEYRDESGATLFSVASSQENMEAYAAGTISKEQFLTGADADLTSLLAQIPELAQGLTP